jgi:hypothetical protein
VWSGKSCGSMVAGLSSNRRSFSLWTVEALLCYIKHRRLGINLAIGSVFLVFWVLAWFNLLALSCILSRSRCIGSIHRSTYCHQLDMMSYSIFNCNCHYLTLNG